MSTSRTSFFRSVLGIATECGRKVNESVSRTACRRMTDINMDAINRAQIRALEYFFFFFFFCFSVQIAPAEKGARENTSSLSGQCYTWPKSPNWDSDRSPSCGSYEAVPSTERVPCECRLHCCAGEKIPLVTKKVITHSLLPSSQTSHHLCVGAASPLATILPNTLNT